MSGSVTNFAGTLTGGIQDISALLPLIGTEQCERHVGSALEGGFLYAAATPLSLFGSLGIVRAGISVLIASISIPKPSLSLGLPKLSFSEDWWFFDGIPIPIPLLKFTPLPKLSFTSRTLLAHDFEYYKPSLKLSLPKLSFTSSGRLWCGARVLDNAGFKLVGRVAPLIGMDEKRYKAESRLIEILEEKHIDTPEKLSIDWRSAEWNVWLAIGTIVAALISGTPYLYLLLKDPLGSIHSPWVFPFLRTVGSCLATICCQFLLQSRVISLMKSRIVFMIVHRALIDDLKKGKGDQVESVLKDQQLFQWDESLPAEECLWSLEQYLLSELPSARDNSYTFRQYMFLLKGLIHTLLSKVRITKAEDIETNSCNSDNALEEWVNLASPGFIREWPFSDLDHILHTLLAQHADHFPTPYRHRIFIIVSWFLLSISLPAAVAGYIGCFTLVTNSQLSSSGPLGWLGLEAALSALRILLWAWNPSFDEKTGVEVRLELTKEQPLVTTQWDVDELRTESHPWPLLPERKFLEQITPYTGPLAPFKIPDNTALYFVSAVNKELTEYRLFMTVLDLTNRTAFTLYMSGDTRSSQDPVYATTVVTPDTDSSEMLASIQWDTMVSVDHPRRINIPIHDLAKYYNSLLHSLTSSMDNRIAILPRGWSLAAKEPEKERKRERETYVLASPSRLAEGDLRCFQQHKEHLLKTRLMQILGKWVVDGVGAMYHVGRNDCYLALATSDEAKREYALNVLLVREWTKRELAHLQLSAALENVLHSHVQQNAKMLERKIPFSLEWSYDLQKQRLEYERAQVKVRREDMMKTVEQNGFASIWQAGQTFVEEKWTAAIGLFEEGSTGFPETTTEHEWFGESDDEMRALVEQLKPRFARWNVEWSSEQREMEATLGRISEVDVKQLEQAYRYPQSSARLAGCIHSTFVRLPSDSEEAAFAAKFSSAAVYDVIKILTIDIIRTVAEKSSCRSLINVRPRLIEHIPENDHILFCSDNYRQGVDLCFIQRNRNQWWEQQKRNSWTFYLSPQGVDGQYVYSDHGTIAHVMIFLRTPTRLRLHLLHGRIGDSRLSVQEKGKELRLVHPAEMSWDKLSLQDYNLDHRFEPGRHELQLVVVQNRDAFHRYHLRDVVVEFVDDPLHQTLLN